MSYTAPTISASGTTFTQLQSLGHNGMLQALMAHNSLTAAQQSLVNTMLAQSPGLQGLFTLIADYLRGAPIAAADVAGAVTNFAVALHTLQEYVDEIGTLLEANGGTLRTRQNGAGNVETYRTFP